MSVYAIDSSSSITKLNHYDAEAFKNTGYFRGLILELVEEIERICIAG